MNPIVWIDCEMTGLDRHIDELVEVSVVITDYQLTPLDEGIDVLIRPSAQAEEHMNDFVRAMHTNSGLIHEWKDGVSLHEAQKQVLEYIQRFVPEAGKAPLGGNSVATDKFFLEKYMPEVVSHLHYRIIDVSSIKELSKRWYPAVYGNSPEKTGNHRALGDIYDSIDELRYYRRVLFPAAGTLASTEELREAARECQGVTLSLVTSDAHTPTGESQQENTTSNQ